ncbi:MAG TPA: flagellar biosynthetic protein FliO, partial [Lacipirellulaceae bacterium]|nr:flagellar biosynthetic protein FliO [Lacipirellulaceae bacterium]
MTLPARFPRLLAIAAALAVWVRPLPAEAQYDDRYAGAGSTLQAVGPAGAAEPLIAWRADDAPPAVNPLRPAPTSNPPPAVMSDVAVAPAPAETSSQALELEYELPESAPPPAALTAPAAAPLPSETAPDAMLFDVGEPVAARPLALVPPASSEDRRLVPPTGGRSAALGPTDGRRGAITSSLRNLPSLPTAGAAVAAVAALYLACSWMLRGGKPASSGALPAEAFAVLGRAPLTSQSFAQLVRLGNKLVLLAVGANGATALAEVTDPEEVDRIAGLCHSAGRGGSSAEFQQVLA